MPRQFDAEAPFTPRGCIAQAWGVAEFLRARLLLDRADLSRIGNRGTG